MTFLLFAVIACGKRGDPLPPLRLVPAPVQELKVSQRGPFIELSWISPSRNTDGSTDVSLERAEVWRRVLEPPPKTTAPASEQSVETSPPKGIPPPEGVAKEEEEKKKEEDAPASEAETAEPSSHASPPSLSSELGAPEPPDPPAAIPFDQEAEVVARLEVSEPSAPVQFREPWDPSWSGKRVEYAVRHVNRKGRASPFSAVAHVEPTAPLPVPLRLRTEVGDGHVLVRWELEAEESRKRSLGYRVFRRTGEGDYPVAPTNAELLTEATFRDPDVAYGQSRCYMVRSVLRASGVSDSGVTEGTSETGALIESADSEEACVTPVDTFAPPRPSGLVAVSSTLGIVLSWEVVDVPDVRGYWVYRARDPQGSWHKLTAEPVAVASFTDRSVERGQTYYYAVSAVDTAQPPNESEPSDPVEVAASGAF